MDKQTLKEGFYMCQEGYISPYMYTPNTYKNAFLKSFHFFQLIPYHNSHLINT